MEKISLYKKVVIFVLAFIGFLTTIKLAVIYYDANFNPYALPSFCSVNNFIDCDGIAKTTESQFFGVPLAYWGMFFYLFVIVLLFAEKLKNIRLLKFLEVFKNPLDYIALLGIFSFIVSMTLLCVSLFSIEKLCILCAFTYVLNLLIGLVAIDYGNGGLMKALRQSIADFIDGIKNRAYLIALVAVMLLAGGILSYTNATEVFAPQVKAKKDFAEFVEAKYNKYAVKGNLLGEENAKTVVFIYTDYNCPICGPFDIMIHKAAKEMKSFKVIHKNLPLDTECNKNLKNPFHEGSCTMARYSIAAEKQGKLWDVDAKFFQYRPASEEEILKVLDGIGLDLEKLKRDANSPETYKKLSEEIDAAYALDINATPTMRINAKNFVGIMPYSQLKKTIEEQIEKSK